MKKVVLGITGELLSGKTTAAAFYVEKFGAKHLRFSKLLDEILDVLGLPIVRKHEQDLAVMLKEQFGDAVLVNALIENARSSGHHFVVFEGIRKKEEIEALRELKGFKFVFIKSSLESRYKRSQQRKEKVGENEETFEQFKERQKHSADADLPSLEQYADFIITNNSSREEFIAQLTKVVAQSL